MGLISWFKDTYYKRKLENADFAYHSHDYSEAERIYLEILDSQPNAAEHLGKMYYEVGKSSENKLAYLHKLKELLSKTSNANTATYLTRYVLHIENTADALFMSRNFENASKYLEAIEFARTSDKAFAKKKRLYALHITLNAIEQNPSYKSSLDSVCDYCKTNVDKNIEDAILTTVQRLCTSKKLGIAFVLANCLAKKNNYIAIRKCVSIAYSIYKSGKATEIKMIDDDELLDYISKNSSSNLLIGLEQFAPFTQKYRMQYLKVGTDAIVSESNSKRAFALFKNVWQTTPDVSLIQTFARYDSKISSDVFEYFTRSTDILTSQTTYKDALFKELSNHKDYDYAFAIFEKFQNKGFDVYTEYIAKAKSIFASLYGIKKLSLLNRVLRLYHDNQWAINEKMSWGDTAQAQKDYDTARNIYSELVGLHANAQPKIAQAYLEQSLYEKDLRKKRELICKALVFKKSHNALFDSKEFEKTANKLNSEVLGIIHQCFETKIPDEAYVTAKTFLPYMPQCHSYYIQELKSYKDNDYVLKKLESMHDEGFDIEAVYKDVVNYIYTNEGYTERYKFEVLSKGHIIFKDDVKLYNKLISKGLELIKAETEETAIASTFAAVWSLCSDPLLLDSLVAEKYKYYKVIVEYLLEKETISKWNEKIFSCFCKKVSLYDDFKYALFIFERLNKKGLPVHEPYVATVTNALSKMDINAKLSIVNKTLTKFKDERLLKEKLVIADEYFSDGEYDKSEMTLKEMVGLHPSAEPKLAALYYEKSKNKTLDDKEKLILKGLAFNSEHSLLFSKKEYATIFNKLLKAYDSLIEKYCSISDFENACRLAFQLKSYSNDWVEKSAKVKLSETSNIDNCDSKTKEISMFFSTLETNGVNLRTTKTEHIISLWDELCSSQIQHAHTLSYTECVDTLNDFLSFVSTYCEKNESDTIIRTVKSELSALHKEQGYKHEQECKYLEAINIYDIIYSTADVRTKCWCKLRSTICHVKHDDMVAENDVRKVLGYVGFAKEKKDLAYRYGIWLIKHNGAKSASGFINDFLPEEKELANICYNTYLKDAEDALTNINKEINRLNNRETSLSEAMSLEACIDSYNEIFSSYLPDVKIQIESLRKTISTYILSKCYEEEDYELALKILKASGKNWYEDDIYFRNAAIACLGMTESGRINRTNYKAIISCWLTAVYHDQLFVESLNYTSWDDAYTFSLKNSLGGSNSDNVSFISSLPNNVNFDDPIDGSIISIAEVQQSLLSRFELALNDKDNIFISFYEEQKDAMNSLVRLNTDIPCIIAAPYLANKTRKCIMEIKKALDYEYENYGNESILKIGTLYNINSGHYQEFKKASDYVDNCISAAHSWSVIKVRDTFTSDAIRSIRTFSGLYGAFSTEIQNILNEKTRKGSSYKTTLDTFSIICDMLRDTTLSYIFGNFINQSVVDKLNDEGIDLATGLKDLVTAYNVAKNCSQLKSNIGNVLEALVQKYLTEVNSSDLSSIKSVLDSTGTEFESNIANALSEQIVILTIATGNSNAIDSLVSIPARTAILRNKLNSLKSKAKEISVNMELSNIVEKVNNKTLAYYSALQKVYGIYKNNQNNSRVCNNLCTLIGMCIREYVIPEKYGKDMVMAVFNELKYNKSSTYKTSAQALRTERQEILNQLPPEARTLLTGGASISSTLNDAGIKLKYALQLYLDLA